jgi:hypothetical protein
MVSPVRIRVPPLKKVLQIVEKGRPSAASPELCVNSPLRKRPFLRVCWGILRTVCGVRVHGEGLPGIGMS